MRGNIRKAAGPGQWNDYDMMEVGNGFTDAENRSHFAMWSMLTSPLVMGNDLRTASKETVKTLANKEVIAVNQDKLGIPALRFTNEGDFEIWVKPLADDEWAMVIVNMADAPRTIDFDWNKHQIGDDLHNRQLDIKNKKYKIRDLYNHNDIGDTSKNLKATIDSHDVLMVRLRK